MDKALVGLGVVLVVVLPLLVVVARTKGHLRRTREAIDAVRWISWLTLLGFYVTVLIGFYVTAPVALVYVFRLARPFSWWAVRFYNTDKIGASRRRYCGADSPFLTAMELKSRIGYRLPTTVWGYDMEQVDRFLQRVFEAVMALEGDPSDRVVIPGDLMVRPSFRRAWGGYNPGAVWATVEDFGESLVGHKLVHAPY